MPTSVVGRTVVAASVPMGMAAPYFVRPPGRENGVFARAGAVTRIADEDKIRELGFAGAGKSFDSRPCRGMTVEKRDVRKVTAAQLEIGACRSSATTTASRMMKAMP